MTKDIQTTDEQIRTRAYYIWEADGRPHGRDQEYWHRAKKELSTQKNPTQPSNGTERRALPMVTDAKRKSSVRSPAYA